MSQKGIRTCLYVCECVCIDVYVYVCECVCIYVSPIISVFTQREGVISGDFILFTSYSRLVLEEYRIPSYPH